MAAIAELKTHAIRSVQVRETTLSGRTVNRWFTQYEIDPRVTPDITLVTLKGRPSPAKIRQAERKARQIQGSRDIFNTQTSAEEAREMTEFMELRLNPNTPKSPELNKVLPYLAERERETMVGTAASARLSKAA